MSNKNYLILFIQLYLISSFSLSAQDDYKKNMYALISAENTFAAMAEQKTIKQGFLHFLDSSAILFNGINAINGRELYLKMPDSKEELLKWYPTFAQLSRSGDIGFTTGPFSYHQKRNEAPISSGHFFSLWQRNVDGKYKVILDGGVINSKNHNLIFENKVKLNDSSPIPLNIPAAPNNGALEVEPILNQFFASAINNPINAYGNYLSNKAIILRNDIAVNGRNIVDNLELLNHCKIGGYTFKANPVNYSRDYTFAYCFGTVKINTEGSSKVSEGYFVQVWQYEKNGWRITADVINIVP